MGKVKNESSELVPLETVGLGELTEHQIEATILAAQQVLAVLKTPNPGDPYEFDYEKRLFGFEIGVDGGVILPGYTGTLPGEVPRAACTAYLTALARTGEHVAAAGHTKYSGGRWKALLRVDATREAAEDGKTPGDFTRMRDEALEVHAGALYEAAHHVGFSGTTEVVFHAGMAVGVKKTKNARLMELILKAKHKDFMPEKLSDVAKAGGVLIVTGSLNRDDWNKKYSEDGPVEPLESDDGS